MPGPISTEDIGSTAPYDELVAADVLSIYPELESDIRFCFQELPDEELRITFMSHLQVMAERHRRQIADTLTPDAVSPWNPSKLLKIDGYKDERIQEMPAKSFLGLVAVTGSLLYIESRTGVTMRAINSLVDYVKSLSENIIPRF